MTALVVYAYPNFSDSSSKITCQKELSSHFNKESLHLNFVSFSRNFDDQMFKLI